MRGSAEGASHTGRISQAKRLLSDTTLESAVCTATKGVTFLRPVRGTGKRRKENSQVRGQSTDGLLAAVVLSFYVI